MSLLRLYYTGHSILNTPPPPRTQLHRPQWNVFHSHPGTRHCQPSNNRTHQSRSFGTNHPLSRKSILTLLTTYILRCRTCSPRRWLVIRPSRGRQRCARWKSSRQSRGTRAWGKWAVHVGCGARFFKLKLFLNFFYFKLLAGFENQHKFAVIFPIGIIFHQIAINVYSILKSQLSFWQLATLSSELSYISVPFFKNIY